MTAAIKATMTARATPTPIPTAEEVEMPEEDESDGSAGNSIVVIPGAGVGSCQLIISLLQSMDHLLVSSVQV